MLAECPEHFLLDILSIICLIATHVIAFGTGKMLVVLNFLLLEFSAKAWAVYGEVIYQVLYALCVLSFNWFERIQPEYVLIQPTVFKRQQFDTW